MRREDLYQETIIGANGVASLVFELEQPAKVVAARAAVDGYDVSELEACNLTVTRISAEGIEYLTSHAPLSSVCADWAPSLDLRGDTGQMIWFIVENREERHRLVRLQLFESLSDAQFHRFT